MTNAFRDQEKFMKACDQTTDHLNQNQFDMYVNLIQEELDELLDDVEDDMNDEDIEDDREERLDEVALAGPETGARRISGAPDSGMSMDYGSCDTMPKMKLVLRKKVMKKLKDLRIGEIIK